jgi:hypothetical protein
MRPAIGKRNEMKFQTDPVGSPDQLYIRSPRSLTSPGIVQGSNRYWSRSPSATSVCQNSDVTTQVREALRLVCAQKASDGALASAQRADRHWISRRVRKDRRHQTPRGLVRRVSSGALLVGDRGLSYFESPAAKGKKRRSAAT